MRRGDVAAAVRTHREQLALRKPRREKHQAEPGYRNVLAECFVRSSTRHRSFPVLTNQLALAQNLNLQVGASIRMIKALGGGWESGS